LFYAREKGLLDKLNIQLLSVVSLSESLHTYKSKHADIFLGTQYEYEEAFKRDNQVVPIMLLNKSDGGDVVMSNLTLEEIKKILDVDLINEDLGKKLYSNKENKLSVEKATKNLINCRFCEQMLNVYSQEEDKGCKFYSLCDYSNNLEHKDYTMFYIIIFNDELYKRNRVDVRKDVLEYFKNINEKGNIYNQLNSKYISQTFEEWCISQSDPNILPLKKCERKDIKHLKEQKD